MKLLCLPCIENRQLQYLAEETIRICQPITTIQPALFKVKSNLDLFKNEIRKGYGQNKSRSELEKIRNRLITGLMHDVKAELFFPHTNAELMVIKKALGIAKKFGSSISRLPAWEATSAIEMILNELHNLEKKVLNETAIYRWIPLIEEANEKYKQIEIQNSLEDDDTLQIVHTYSVVTKLIDSLENLYIFLFAYAEITENKSLKHAYSRIEELVESLD